MVKGGRYYTFFPFLLYKNMVQFNELRISPYNQCMIIDVSIIDSNLYDNVYIDSIIIDTQDTYTDNGPSSSPIYSLSIDEEISGSLIYTTTGDCVPVKESDTNQNCLVEAQEREGEKHYRLVLTSQDINLNESIYFIYVTTKGIPDPSTPCTMDNQTTLGIIWNDKYIFNQFIPYIKELAKNCVIPKNFIDIILRYKAFELALESGNYVLAIDFWNKYFKNTKVNKPSSWKCPYA